MKNIFFNLLLVLRSVYRSFGLLPTIIFMVFLIFVLAFILFELAQSYLPFTYVAF